MKIFVATDIHGSAFWAKKVVDAFEQSQSDLLVLLGDIYNHGPRNPFPQDYAPMRVAEILTQVADKLIVIKGNCDSEVDQMISNFQFMQDNTLVVQGKRLFFTHGHVYNKDNLPLLPQGSAMFYGHFHVNAIVCRNGITCVNVGSCALPKDGLNTYCIVDGTRVEIFTFDGKTVATADL